MGFFAKLLGLSKEVELDEISLEPWFRGETESKLSRSEAHKEELRSQFNQKIIDLKDAISSLENAELQNPNVPIRTLDFMHGNRENYIKQVNLLISDLPELGEDFNEKFTKLLDDFSKRTTRSYQILNEFFEHETKNVAFKIKEISETAQNYIIPDPKVAVLQNILSQIRKLESNKEKVSELKQEVNELQDKLSDYEKQTNEMDEKIENIKNSDESEKLSGLKELIKQKKRKLNEIEVTIINLFSPFSKLIRKYERQSIKYGKLLKDYDKDSLEAFENDSEMNIIEAVKEGIEKSASLGFNEKDQEKLRERISSFNVIGLANIKGEYKQTKQTLKEAKDQLTNITLEEDIKDLHRQEKSLGEKVHNTKKEIDELYSKITKTNEESSQIKLDLPSLLEGVTGVKVKLK